MDTRSISGPSRAAARHPIAGALLGSALAVGAGSALAAGFQLNETSASGLGNAFAGGAAAAEDATTLWSNIAGLSRLGSRQAVGVLHTVTPVIQFGDRGSVAAAQQGLGSTGGDAGSLNLIPNLYLALPLDSRWSAGLAVTAPWGLVTEYSGDWIGRFQGLKSSIQTLNVNPGLSLKAAPGLALGLGLNVQRMEAEFTNQVNYSAALLGAAQAAGIPPTSATYAAIAQATPGLESAARIKGSDNGYGWNAGLLWELTPQQRIGAQYRSSVRYSLTGNARFDNPTPVVAGALGPTVAALANAVNTRALFDAGIRSEVKIPPIVNLSWFGAVDPRFDLMADLQWTGWSTIETLRFERSDGTLLQSTPEHFKDSWKLALGLTYRPGGDWLWRGGLAFDQSPVRDAYRTPRLPDADRAWLSGGLQWRASSSLRVDLGAAYLWSRKASINADGGDPTGQAAGLLNGRYDNHTVIVSGQAVWSF